MKSINQYQDEKAEPNNQCQKPQIKPLGFQQMDSDDHASSPDIMRTHKYKDKRSQLSSQQLQSKVSDNYFEDDFEDEDKVK